jgi:hypothetical protein
MSHYGISPHIKYEGDGKVWFKKSVRPIETYGANEYNRSPPANLNPSKARAESRQERAIIKQVMGEAIKNQQAAAALLAMKRNEKGGRRRSTHKKRAHRRRRVTRRF